MPLHSLRLGEYLFHTGRIPWRALVEAVAWQRQQRPRIGRIAVDFGFLRQEDVLALLRRRREARASHLPFGEFALKEGLLTRFQLLASVGRQRQLQRPIGQFFVERGFIAEAEIEAIRRRLFFHNARWSR